MPPTTTRQKDAQDAEELQPLTRSPDRPSSRVPFTDASPTSSSSSPSSSKQSSPTTKTHRRVRSSSPGSAISDTSFVFHGIDMACKKEAMAGLANSRGTRSEKKTARVTFRDADDSENDADGHDDDDHHDPVSLRYSKERPFRDVPGGGNGSRTPDNEHSSGLPRPADKRFSRCVCVLAIACALSWGAVILLFLFGPQTFIPSVSSPPYHSNVSSELTLTPGTSQGEKISLEKLLSGHWRPKSRKISWIPGADGQDGLLLERASGFGSNTDEPFLSIRDVETSKDKSDSTVLMKRGDFKVNGETIQAGDVWPSPDLKKVLVVSNKEANWRHSFTGRYWIFDVESQTAEPLDPDHSQGLPARVQLAVWSPTSDAIAFTRSEDMNLYLRVLSEKKTRQITTDGGENLYYGVPDWVYEEEVFAGRVGTWWSPDGQRLAFLRTNESAVPTYPVQYFISRPSGKDPLPGQENYPETREIKYPKAGAPNPIVSLGFYDLASQKTKSDIPFKGSNKDFADDDRLITEVFWAGSDFVLARETNRESDVLKVVVWNLADESAQVVREQNVTALDGGWLEVTQTTKFIPAAPELGRLEDGYVDTVPINGFDHLAYFSPVNASSPRAVLTAGSWEVITAPSAVDLARNVVYFIATKDGTQNRHLYYVNLLPGPDGTIGEPVAVTDTSKDGYFDVSFSAGSGYALLSYQGPEIPWQKVISTPVADLEVKGHKAANGPRFEHILEDNSELAGRVEKLVLPTLITGSIKLNGVEMNFLERRPADFNPEKKYPVLFQMYQGPASQTVDSRWKLDFQTYVAATLGYVVVTVDGRGTGYKGREFRCIIRGNIGEYESQDQIAAGKEWASRPYVDPERLAIWGWSYGGFTTLKVLERDGGETFKYGMAVAPVTDWAFYDSIYTERYMRTPAHNEAGYRSTAIADIDKLRKNVRFLVMHGVADDNVHMQSTLKLVDDLHLRGVRNYDMHMFPDSNHGIYFHNASEIVFGKLRDWLVTAFNGHWVKLKEPMPNPMRRRRGIDGPLTSSS